MGAIAERRTVPMFLGAMIMGPLGGWSMKKLDALWAQQDPARLRDAGQQLLRRHLAACSSPWSASWWRVRFVEWFSARAGDVIDFLVDNSLLPLTSIFIEPAKVLFLNNAINHGVLTPLGLTEASENGQVHPVPARGQPGRGLPACCWPS